MSAPTAQKPAQTAAQTAAQTLSGGVLADAGPAGPSHLDEDADVLTALPDLSDAPADALAADPAAVQHVLDGRWAHVRERSRATIPAAWCEPTDHLSTAEHRAVTLARLQEVAATGEHRYGFAASSLGGSPEATGGDSVGAQTVNFEMLGHADLSLTIKAGVQWGLFAGSIQALGTAQHHERYLRDAVETRLPRLLRDDRDRARLRRRQTCAPPPPTTSPRGEFVVHSPDAQRPQGLHRQRRAGRAPRRGLRPAGDEG